MIEKKVFIYVYDPGCISALETVVDFISNRADVHFYVSELSWNSLNNKALAKKENPEILDIIKNDKFDTVICGTSMSTDSMDKSIIEVARNKDIKTITFVDYWANYANRYTNELGDLVYLSDIILAINDEMKSALTDIGIPEKTIKITGHPFFDRYLHTQANHNNKNKSITNILFISEPIYEVYGEQSESFEFKSLQMLMAAAKNLENYNKINVIVRLHPKEKSGKYVDYRISEANRLEPIGQVLEDVDIVVGMTSAVLMQSYAMGIPTISIQNSNTDKFILTRDQYIETAGDIDALSRSIAKYLKSKKSEGRPNIYWLSDGHSTEKFADIILQ